MIPLVGPTLLVGGLWVLLRRLSVLLVPVVSSSTSSGLVSTGGGVNISSADTATTGSSFTFSRAEPLVKVKAPVAIATTLATPMETPKLERPKPKSPVTNHKAPNVNALEPNTKEKSATVPGAKCIPVRANRPKTIIPVQSCNPPRRPNVSEPLTETDDEDTGFSF